MGSPRYAVLWPFSRVAVGSLSTAALQLVPPFIREVQLLYTCTGKKTPGGAGTHTGHTGHTGARGHTDHTDEPHNHPPKPNDTYPHDRATAETATEDRLNSRKNISCRPGVDRSLNRSPRPTQKRPPPANPTLPPPAPRAPPRACSKAVGEMKARDTGTERGSSCFGELIFSKGLYCSCTVHEAFCFAVRQRPLLLSRSYTERTQISESQYSTRTDRGIVHRVRYMCYFRVCPGSPRCFSVHECTGYM